MLIMHENPANVIDVKQQLALGEWKYHADTQSWYQYVQNGSASPTWSVGKLVSPKTGGSRGVLTQLDADHTPWTLVDNGIASGMAVAALPTLYFGFILVQGRTALLQTDDSAVDGGPLVMSGGATATFLAHLAIATEEHQVFGHANAADTGTDPYYVDATVRFIGV